LRGIDGVVVNATEGFRDGNVLNEQHNDRGGKLAGQSLEELYVNMGCSNMLEACE